MLVCCQIRIAVQYVGSEVPLANSFLVSGTSLAIVNAELSWRRLSTTVKNTKTLEEESHKTHVP